MNTHISQLKNRLPEIPFYFLFLPGKSGYYITVRLENSKKTLETVLFSCHKTGESEGLSSIANETVSRILERVEYLGHMVNFKTSKPDVASCSKCFLTSPPHSAAVFLPQDRRDAF